MSDASGRRISIPVSRRLQAVLDDPSSLALSEDLSQAQLISTLVEEAIEKREAMQRAEARRARYAVWAKDLEYQRAIAADAAVAMSEKAI